VAFAPNAARGSPVESQMNETLALLDFFVSDVQPWDQMDPAIPKYDLYPPSTE